MELPEVAELNELPADAFANALALLFEDAPGFLHRLADARPFESDAALLAAAREAASVAPEEEAIELVGAHPRIGALPAEMSMQSLAEQEDGRFLETLVETELAALNNAYEERFGFRYVVFVAGRPRTEIVPLMKAALGNDRPTELRRALNDVMAIAADRLHATRTTIRQPEEIGS